MAIEDMSGKWHFTYTGRPSLSFIQSSFSQHMLYVYVAPLLRDVPLLTMRICPGKPI